MFKGKWRWVIISLIIIVALGLVLHYYQDRYAEHYRVSRIDNPNSDLPDEPPVDSGKQVAKSSEPGFVLKVQRLWRNYWANSDSGQNTKAPPVRTPADSTAKPTPAKKAQPAPSPSAQRNDLRSSAKSQAVPVGPLPHIAQYGRQGAHAAHPMLAGREGQAVQTLLIHNHMLGLLVESVGTLHALQDISIAPQIAGNIASIDYKPGTLVQAGDLLFTLDSRIYKANLAKAQSELALSKSDFERYAPLATKGLVSKQQLEKAHEKYKSDLAEVKVNQTYLDQMHLRAPFAGYVGAKNVSVGDYVTVGQPLTKLVDRNNLLVNFLVPAEYLSQLELGQQVTVTVPEQGDPTVVGQVNYIAPEVDAKTHSVTVQARIDNKTIALTPGLFVQVKLKIDAGEQALLVPQSAVILQNNKHVVYVVVNGRAYSKAVITGKIINNKVSITNGLSAGDAIVIVGQQQLHNGAKVYEVKP